MASHPDPPPGEPPPSVWSFVERPLWRIALESVLGATAGALLAGPLDADAMRWALAFGGGVLAPMALLLTPVHGSLIYRSLRYGIALAVLAALVVSFSGEGRDRPIDEVLAWGLAFMILGSLAHGCMVAALPAGHRLAPDRASADGQASEAEGPEDGQTGSSGVR